MPFVQLLPSYLVISRPFKSSFVLCQLAWHCHQSVFNKAQGNVGSRLSNSICYLMYA